MKSKQKPSSEEESEAERVLSDLRLKTDRYLWNVGKREYLMEILNALGTQKDPPRPFVDRFHDRFQMKLETTFNLKNHKPGLVFDLLLHLFGEKRGTPAAGEPPGGMTTSNQSLIAAKDNIQRLEAELLVARENAKEWRLQFERLMGALRKVDLPEYNSRTADITMKQPDVQALIARLQTSRVLGTENAMAAWKAGSGTGKIDNRSRLAAPRFHPYGLNEKNDQRH